MGAGRLRGDHGQSRMSSMRSSGSFIFSLLLVNLAPHPVLSPQVAGVEPAGAKAGVTSTFTENGSDGESTPRVQLWQQPTATVLDTVIRHVHWSDVTLIFDDEHKQEVQELSERLSDHAVPLIVFRYSGHLLDVQLHGLLHTGADPRTQPLHLLLLCSQRHTSRIMQTAEEYQSKHRMTSTLSLASQWLLLEDGDGPDTDLSHVTMVNVAVIRCLDATSCCKTAPSAEWSCGQMRTLLWQGDVSHWNYIGLVDDVIYSGAEVFPGRKWGFNRRLLNIGTLSWEAFVQTSVTSEGDLVYTGLCIDLLTTLAEQHNFTYNLSQPADGIFGMTDDNGTWLGLIGQLVYSKVDMVVAPLTVTALREEVVDFTYGYFNDAEAFIYRMPDSEKDKWGTYLQPFKWQVLLCIAVSLVVGSALLGFLEAWTPFYACNRLSENRGRLTCYFRSLRLMYGALLTQGDEHLPRSHCGRMMVSSWWIFSIVVTATYSGNLIAFLTVDKTEPLFNTFWDLLEQDLYRWGFIGGATTHHAFESTNTITSLHSQLWSRVKAWSADDPDWLSSDVSVHYQRLVNGQYAFISDRSILQRWKAQRCDLQLAHETLFTVEYGLVLPNNSPYVRTFSDTILLMHENGQLEQLRETWFGSSNNSCAAPTTATADIVTLVDTQTAFYLLLIGAALGGLVLAAEHVLTLPVWARLQDCIRKRRGGDGGAES